MRLFVFSLAASAALALAAPASAAVFIPPSPVGPTGPGGGGNQRAMVTVITRVVNDHAGALLSNSFLMTVGDGTTPFSTFAGQEAPGMNIAINPGVYVVGGSDQPGYVKTMVGACAGMLAANESATCTVTYDDVDPNAPVCPPSAVCDDATPPACPPSVICDDPTAPACPPSAVCDGMTPPLETGGEPADPSAVPPAPQVLGATDELPRTGTGTGVIAFLVAAMVSFRLSRRARS